MTLREITQDSLPDLAKGQGHKYDHGHAVVLSGGPGRSGAARLAARGALRIGAGLVSVACPNSALFENAAHLTSIMLRPIDGPSGFLELLEDVRVSSLALGPGLGITKITADLLKVAMETGKPAVVDADALSRFAHAPETLFALLHDKVVMTPHGGEFRRLFPDLAEAALGDVDAKFHATHQAAQRAGCVVVLKGAETTISDPAGNGSVHLARGPRSVPWLATAGAGDVLTGFVGGLMARGVPAMAAAEASVWLHVECALQVGPGLIAEDLPEQLPKVLHHLLT